jgi:hypothetical protein
MSAKRETAPPRFVLLSSGQAEAAGAILARSHADYPSFRHLFPDDERRPRVLAAMFTGVARDAARLGSAYGALGGDGELRGVALWLAPGRFPWSALRQLRGSGWMLSILRADRLPRDLPGVAYLPCLAAAPGHAAARRSPVAARHARHTHPTGLL